MANGRWVGNQQASFRERTVAATGEEKHFATHRGEEGFESEKVKNVLKEELQKVLKLKSAQKREQSPPLEEKHFATHRDRLPN